MKWKMKRSVEKAIEILETLDKDRGNSLKQKILSYFSFVYKYGSVELLSNYDDPLKILRFHLIYENGRYFIRCYHYKRMDYYMRYPYCSSEYFEDTEL
jgi:hypothetical protein